MHVGEYEKLSAVAKRLGVSRRVVYDWARYGSLPGAIQFNGTWLVKISDLNRHLAQLHARRGKLSVPQQLPHTQVEELNELGRRLTEYITMPTRFSRPMPELRKAVESGTATGAEIAEVRALDFWRAWSIHKPSLSPALRDRFSKRTLTAEDLAAIRLKVSRPRRS